jgi:hypothetical protein
MTVNKPQYPLHQLVTFELRDYRAELEQALARTPEQAADRQLLGQRLTEVIREQESRAAPADTGRWADLSG